MSFMLQERSIKDIFQSHLFDLLLLVFKNIIIKDFLTFLTTFCLYMYIDNC